MKNTCCIVYEPSRVLRHAVSQDTLFIATEVLMHKESKSLVQVTYLCYNNFPTLELQV